MELLLIVLAFSLYVAAFITGVATTMVLGTRLDNFDRHYIKKLDLKEMWLMMWSWKQLYIVPVISLILASGCLFGVLASIN